MPGGRVRCWLERELGVPVLQAIAARIWEIQKRLHEPIKGYDRLLQTLPAERAGGDGRVSHRSLFVADDKFMVAIGAVRTYGDSVVRFVQRS
jgi:hypothetical protein